MQLVVMSILKDEEIGMEVHPKTSQFVRVEKGNCSAIIDDKRYRLGPGDAIIIPPGKRHNIKNTGVNKLKLYTIYTPSEHPDGLKEKYKTD